MRVIVVGAGIAGLGAAYRLREQGHEVVLLEKDAEPGGRCRSVLWHGQWAVTGAFAFLGSETNLIEQAQKLGLYTPDQLAELLRGADVPCSDRSSRCARKPGC